MLSRLIEKFRKPELYKAKRISANHLLQNAAKTGDLLSAKTMLKAGAKIKDQDRNGCTALMTAAEHGNLEIVKLFLHSKTANLFNNSGLEVKNNLGNTALLLAASQGHEEVAAYLLQKGANLSAKNNSGQDALILATIAEHHDLVAGLLTKGANPNVQDKKGNTPLIIAARNNSVETVNLLINKGATLLQLNVAGEVAFHLAAQKGHVEVVKIFLRHCMPIDARDIQGYTALMRAAMYGHKDVVATLLERGANASINAHGKTALKLAKLHAHNEVVNILKAYTGVAHNPPSVAETLKAHQLSVQKSQQAAQLRQLRKAQTIGLFAQPKPVEIITEPQHAAPSPRMG